MAYGAGKAALNQLTRNLAVELAPLVRVNAIGVGGVATKGLEVVLTDDALRAEFEANTPMHRPGQPEDIACAALYFASPGFGLGHRQGAPGRRRHREALHGRAGAAACPGVG